MERSEDLLRAAEETVTILRHHGIEAVVIGAVALAAYHYVRQTEDIDLGVNAEPNTFRAAAEALKVAGFNVELREPDLEDPLGGVIDVSGSFGLLQIVNFGDRFPAVINDALNHEKTAVREGSILNIVPLPHLIALKLYAGGYKSKADIIELLKRNPDIDCAAIRALCAKYRLDGLDELIGQSESN